MKTGQDESLLSRWSRRKLESRQAQDGQPAIEPEEVATAPNADDSPLAAEPAEPPPPLTDADMPAIDSLDTDSDFSPFMSSGVSDDLRNLALRKLFGAPAYNVCDGLDDYDEDYTTYEKLGDIVTSDMKHRIEVEAEKQRLRLAESDAAEGEDLATVEQVDDAAEADEPVEADDPSTQVASDQATAAEPGSETADEVSLPVDPIPAPISRQT